MCIQIHASIYACACACACARRHMYVWMYVCMYVCMYLCMYVCMYVCMHICMCMLSIDNYTHTYTSLDCSFNQFQNVKCIRHLLFLFRLGMNNTFETTRQITSPDITNEHPSYYKGKKNETCAHTHRHTCSKYIMSLHHFALKIHGKERCDMDFPSIIFIIVSLCSWFLIACCDSERQLLDLIQVGRLPAIHCADHSRPCEGVKDDSGFVDASILNLQLCQRDPCLFWIACVSSHA